MSKPMLLAQIIPTSGPLFAVLADANGNPQYLSVHCLGVLEHPEQPVRVVAGMIADGQHIEPADRLPHHVGYTKDPNGSNPDWVPLCKAKRQELLAAEEAAKLSKIVIPEGKVAKAWN